jgi:hypothetical protein
MTDAEIMELFRVPSGPVPVVDPEKVKAACEWQMQMERDHPGELCAVASAGYSKPDASVRAIGYRATILWVVRHGMAEALAPWTKEDQLDDAVFRAIAEVPMEWIDGPREGLPFDFADFISRVREAA